MSSDQNKDRIRLAEAMGWRFDHEGPPPTDFGVPRAYYWISPEGERKLTHRSTGFPQGGAELFGNPFTDANDDYAVLEWLRGVMPDDAEYGLFQRVARHLPTLLDYQVGDVARATVRELCPTETED